MILAVVAAVIVFKGEDIKNFFSFGLAGAEKALGEAASGISQAGAGAKLAAEEAAAGVDQALFDPIRTAGVNASKAIQDQQREEAIRSTDAEIERQAIEQGFSSRAEAERETDSGSVVIGSSKNVVDFGLIGNVFPTDPSSEFLAANPEFAAQFLASQTTRGEKRFGGQN